MAIVAGGLARPRIGSIVSFGYGFDDETPPSPVVTGGNARRFRLGPNLLYVDPRRKEEELLLLLMGV